ncbi:OB-fold-containig protein [Altererythrobacter fulvus]|uniref:OB-fold-containig protein n=1 Tax=Caenibius fulvus TaxID=2126012 RepID=UPI0030175ACB
MNLLADHNLPFMAALAVMLLLALAQLLGALDFDSEAGFDADLDGDGHLGFVEGLLSLFGIGRVPFTVWLALFLFLFAGLGVGIQSLAQGLLGAPLDRWLAAGIAVVPALPVTGVVTRPLARILPRDESSAVTLDSLVGRRGRIVTGKARAGFPARAQVRDLYDHPHHLMVVPHEDGAEIAEGEEVLIVRREGETFYCIALQDRWLAPAD